jgi:hypothetical protein
VSGERLPAIPLAIWVQRELDRLYRDETVESPFGRLAMRLGISERLLGLWRDEISSEGEPRFTVNRESAEDALHAADLELVDVFGPALGEEVEVSEVYCSRCHEQVKTDGDGACLWCDGPTSQRRRRGGKPRGVYGKLEDRHLHALHHFHTQKGVSIRELGRRVWSQAGFANAHSAGVAISYGFKRLGLAALSHSEATARSNRQRAATDSPGTADRAAYKRWRRKRNGGYRICQGVKLQAPRKGSPCTRYALIGSEFCLMHDPERRAEIVSRAAEMRSKLPQLNQPVNERKELA